MTKNWAKKVVAKFGKKKDDTDTNERNPSMTEENNDDIIGEASKSIEENKQEDK